MAQRTQITLPPEDHRRARARASDLGVSLAEYIRRLVANDLYSAREAVRVDALFDLGSSGDGSDVAAHKDEYLAEAIEADARTRTRR